MVKGLFFFLIKEMENVACVSKGKFVKGSEGDYGLRRVLGKTSMQM